MLVMIVYGTTDYQGGSVVIGNVACEDHAKNT
jgi:hypothetical protein